MAEEKKSKGERLYGKPPRIRAAEGKGDAVKSEGGGPKAAAADASKTAGKPEPKAEMGEGGDAKSGLGTNTEGIPTHHHDHAMERTEMHHRHMREHTEMHGRHERDHLMRATGHHHESHEEMNERHHNERRTMHTQHESEMRAMGKRHASVEGPGVEEGGEKAEKTAGSDKRIEAGEGKKSGTMPEKKAA